MRYGKFLIVIVLLMSTPAVTYIQVFAQNPQGPAVPTGNNTVTQYCYSGRCSTGGATTQYNLTQGSYPVGQYPNGVPVSHVNRIGIQLSQTCIRMLELNISSNCPSYNKIWGYDTVSPNYAGFWFAKPYLHRGPPIVKNYDNFGSSPFVIVTDPDADFTAKARMIIVGDSSFTYMNPDETSSNGRMILHIDRFVTGCEEAHIAPNVAGLLSDTIKYLESGCTKTNFNDTEITYQKQLPFDIKDSTFLHYMDWLGKAKQVTQNCITAKCSPISDPNHNKGFGWK